MENSHQQINKSRNTFSSNIRQDRTQIKENYFYAF
jgi:hypothetical protein